MKIIVVEDNPVYNTFVCNILAKEGFKTEQVYHLSSARKALIKADNDDIVLADLRLPDGESIELLKWMRVNDKRQAFIIMTDYAEVHTAVESMKLGSLDYIPKQLVEDKLVPLLHSIIKEREQKRQRQVPIFIRQGEAYRNIKKRVHLVAPTRMSVLILGENGTGKEHIAQDIHAQSRFSDKPFVAVDCGALLRDLATSELFGHKKGSFTGAAEDKTGMFAAANHGTLFLDEIGNLNMETQVLLLRALQEKRYRPLGGKEEIQTDIRLLTATNEDLERAISEGRFREDLFHRLNEFPLHVPSLKECPEDIIPLAGFFLSYANEELGKNVKEFDMDVRKAFRAYSWPGNIRELKSVVRRACVLAQDEWITLKDINLPVEIKPSDDYRLDMERTELEAIVKALETTGNDRKAAARLLGISRSTLYLKLKKYGLN